MKCSYVKTRKFSFSLGFATRLLTLTILYQAAMMSFSSLSCLALLFSWSYCGAGTDHHALVKV